MLGTNFEEKTIMAKSRTIEDSSSDDDAPDVVSKSASKAMARRDQKALRNFEIEEKTRRKMRNRERETKLKERALATRGNKHSQVTQIVESGSSDKNISGEDDDDGDLEMAMGDSTDGGSDRRMEARMLRAMQEAVGEDDEDDEEEEFRGFGDELDDADMASDSEDSMSHKSTSCAEDPESISEGSMSEEEESHTPGDVHRSRRPQYLSDDLFAAAFASQKSKPSTSKPSLNRREATRKRQRKPSGRPKDVIVGYATNHCSSGNYRVIYTSHRGRTIRTLTRLTDPRSKATARTLPPARVSAFVEKSLAIKGKGALMKAKQRGWERRPGEPHCWSWSAYFLI